MNETKPQTDADHILIVEDDPGLRQLLSEELTDAGYRVDAVANLTSAQTILTDLLPRLVVSDLRLPDGSGLELLEITRQMPLPPGFIVITAFGTIDQAVDALKQGADDFLTKPLDLDQFRFCVKRTQQQQLLQQEVAYYRKLFDDGDFHGMIGRSPGMRRLFVQIRQIAHAGGPVLITGESGVGKELVARAIHKESSRAERPFIAINCAGIPASLLESELFGHVAGAFTGAGHARKGLFAEADGGTVLLDEIGEMPMEMQPTLLRILQDGRARPIGSNNEIELNIRIIAATNRRLQDDVVAGKFREDLFYRLETFTLEVPPVRERDDDIERLVAHFIGYFNSRLKRDIRGIQPEALERLKAYSFPGNVRELSNIVERAITFCKDPDIGLEHLPERVRRLSSIAIVPGTNGDWHPPVQPGRLPSLESIEQDYIRYVLKQLDGNKQRAAAILGIGRRTLYRRLDPEDKD
jgi:DNA-binding NtrC family response regulator